MRGTAVVASATGGLQEIVQDDETGLLVPPGDPAKLADALWSLLIDPQRTELLGRNGREFALRHLTEDAFVDRFEALYRSMVPAEEPALAQ